MSGLEAAADAVTGGLLAHAVEPGAMVDQTGHTEERACLNCGTALAGDFCHVCGQHGHVHRTLTAFFHDLLHGVFHFEGKIWRTLPMLAWRPGELTRRYIAGERAKFVSPIALFLFGVFLMFGVSSSLGSGINADMSLSRAEVQDGIKREMKDIAKLRQKRAAAVRAGDQADVADIDKDIRESEEAIRALRMFLSAGGRNPDEEVVWKVGIPKLDEGIKKLNTNPALALYKLKSNAYKFSWLLIPLSVPFLWLLFPFSRKYRLYDHTVFVTYSLCFMTFFVVILYLLAMIGTPALVAAGILIPPIHMYRQLRGAYSLSRLSALWRTVALVIFAFTGALLFLLALLTMGIFE